MCYFAQIGVKIWQSGADSTQTCQQQCWRSIDQIFRPHRYRVLLSDRAIPAISLRLLWRAIYVSRRFTYLLRAGDTKEGKRAATSLSVSHFCTFSLHSSLALLLGCRCPSPPPPSNKAVCIKFELGRENESVTAKYLRMLMGTLRFWRGSHVLRCEATSGRLLSNVPIPSLAGRGT